MQIQNTPLSCPRFDSGSCHHRRNAAWQQNGSKKRAFTPPQLALALASQSARENGFDGLADAFAGLLRRDMGLKPCYGRTAVAPTPDFWAVEGGAL
jgi:hypothetical protein